MSSFKDMVEHDVKLMFHNTDFFAEEHTIVIDGKPYIVNVILDHYTERERNVSVTDHSQGLQVNEMMLYADFKDFGFLPKKGLRIWVDSEEYCIEQASCEMGQLALKLEAITE